MQLADNIAPGESRAFFIWIRFIWISVGFTGQKKYIQLYHFYPDNAGEIHFKININLPEQENMHFYQENDKLLNGAIPWKTKTYGPGIQKKKERDISF